MTTAFIILACLALGGAIAAVSLRNLVHCLLCLVVSFLGLAGLYLTLSATFVGLTQVLVYLGAVAILIVFAILLTRGGDMQRPRLTGTASWVVGAGVALLVWGGLLGAVAWRPSVTGPAPGDPSIRAIGERLMSGYVLPLEVIALLLTGALIGAVVLAMGDRRDAASTGPAGPPAGSSGAEGREAT